MSSGLLKQQDIPAHHTGETKKEGRMYAWITATADGL
jgi:hypothetical protein